MADPPIEITTPSYGWSDISRNSGVLFVAWKSNGVSGPLQVDVIRPAPLSAHPVTRNGGPSGEEMIILPNEWPDGEYFFLVRGSGPGGSTVSATCPFRLLPRGSGNISRSPLLSLTSYTSRTIPAGQSFDVHWKTTTYAGKVVVQVHRGNAAGQVLWQTERDVSLGDFNSYIAETPGYTSIVVDPSWGSGHYCVTVSISFRMDGRDQTRSDSMSFYVPS